MPRSDADAASQPPDARPVAVGHRHDRFGSSAAVVLCALVAVLVGGLGHHLAGVVDAGATARERRQIEMGLAEAFAHVTQDQKTGTNWAEAAIQAEARNVDWIDVNIGRWYADFFGHDAVYVTGLDDIPYYAMVGGAMVDPSTFAADAKVLAPVIAKARAALASFESLEQAYVRTPVALSVGPAVVSVSPIVDETGAFAVRPDTAHLHVVIRRLDAAFFDALEDRLLIEGLRLRPARDVTRGHQAIPVVGQDGSVVAYVDWRPARPGATLAAQVAPPFVFFASGTLVFVIFLHLRLRRSMRDLVAQKEQAEHRALHDPLTGLPNRSLLHRRLTEATERLLDDGETFALLCIDLDGFKNVNDTLGHPAGDELLKAVALRLRAEAGPRAVVARLGGDEFAVLRFGDVEVAKVEDLAERIVASIRRPFLAGGHRAIVGASLGIVAAPSPEDDMHELMRKADIALYEAKFAGKNRHRIYDSRLGDTVSRNRRIEMLLRDALAGGPGLDVAFQPIFSSDGATLLGAEALLRFSDPDGAGVTFSPDAVVAVAEERGLMQALGAWVLRRAAEVARETALPFVAVNASASQIQDPGFAEQVLAILQEARLDPELLQIEITETAYADASDVLLANLARLRFAGVSIALDDFGTGYSSLRSLQRIKVDKIKIDRSFVSRLGAHDESDAIVQIMMDLAKTLALDVTAEGVETEDQRRRLAALGAPQMQGYLFSRPVSPDALERAIQTRPSDAPRASLG